MSAVSSIDAGAPRPMLRLQPRQATGVLIETLDDEVIMCNPANDLIICCNATAALIWQLCNGKRCLEDIAAMLSAAYPGSEAMIREQVPEVVQMLVGQGALELA